MQRFVAHVAPKVRGREARANHHGAPAREHRADRHHAADAVVERQAVVHAVLGRGVHQPRKPLAPAHHPVVGDLRRLRQAGGAGGVDVERRGIERRRRVVGGGRRLWRQTREDGLERREFRRAPAVGPDADFGIELRPHGSEPGRKLGADHGQARRGDADRMHQSIARKMRVEERHRHPDARKPEPHRHVLGAIRHQQRRHIPRLEALC